MNIDPKMDPTEFWEQHYEKATSETSGRPTAVLEKFVTDRTSGAALELGCGKGDDAVWLAKNGWAVTAIDISATAMGYARANAVRNGVLEKITFDQRDLMTDFPKGSFALVTAQFLESPVVFARNSIINCASRLVAPGGLLLVTSHGSVPSWSWEKPDKYYPKPTEALENLSLDLGEWTQICVDNLERLAKGPNGEEGMVLDTVIALERKG
ncbi:class I SAM-dependent methyltransferase [Thalassospira lucentensis]|uniref:class I SAM-dependent methyltransferase n=1 Tax=Thalassospira lucentensis TaxID=168935 RepID=UPI003AA8774D